MNITRRFFRREHAGNPGWSGTESVVAVAPDKFKGTLPACEVAARIAGALRSAYPRMELKVCPMADGGEGTAELIARERHLEPAVADGHDAMMRPARIGYFRSGTVCAVDSAAVVGLAMLGRTVLRPWLATSYALGEFIKHMLDNGVEELFVGIGGTATIDGGMGMLQALGARFRDADGEIIPAPAAACDLSSVYSADFSEVPRSRLRSVLTVLSDVDVPLIPCESADDSSHGMSSLSFAPQKGVADDELPQLEKALANFATAVDNALYPPSEEPRFHGAGGGLGYAFHRVLRCRCTEGAEYFTSLYHLFDTDRTRIDCVVTGEGRFDNQSLQGKVTGNLFAHASRMGIPTVVFAGSDTCTLASTGRPHVVAIRTPDADGGTSCPASRDEALREMDETLPRLVEAVGELCRR